MLKIKLKSIKRELADCRLAWSANPDAKFAWCCHHAILIEPLTEMAKNRIQYILSYKSENEQAARLRNFRPVRIELPAECDKACEEWNKARAEWNKAYAEYDKARAEYDKAYAEWNKAYAEYNKAYTEWNKACAEWNKELTAPHNQDWPDNSWNGKDIF